MGVVWYPLRLEFLRYIAKGPEPIDELTLAPLPVTDGMPKDCRPTEDTGGYSCEACDGGFCIERDSAIVGNPEFGKFDVESCGLES